MLELWGERVRYEILHQDAFPVVRCELSRGESLKAESDAMVAMSANLDVSGSMGDGGFLGGLARKFLAGESFFKLDGSRNLTVGPCAIGQATAD